MKGEVIVNLSMNPLINFGGFRKQQMLPFETICPKWTSFRINM